jgi:nicotinamide-nucleotide amidase
LHLLWQTFQTQSNLCQVLLNINMIIKVCIINIGNELLLGQTINTNLSWLGMQLAELGLPVTRSVIIRDVPSEIKQTLAKEWVDNDVIIITGGLGPTDDDLTISAIAEYFDKQLEFRLDVWQSVQALFERRNIETPQINRSQAMVPSGFTALLNNVGTAPGLYYSENNKSLYILPGVPAEMKFLFNEYIIDMLSRSYSLNPVFMKTLHTWKISESALAENLLELKPPDEVQLAWLPQTGRVDLRIYGTDSQAVEKFADNVYAQVKERVWGIDNDIPQTLLQNLMIEKNYTLSVAESCTGGLVQEILTSVPGSSGYFLGGIVSYSNEIKIKHLNIKQSTLTKYGAVSVETATEMAEGVRNATKSTYGIAITGIAGPDGGSEDKPVGTVCFAISDKTQKITRSLVFNGDRPAVRRKAAEYIILLLIETIRNEQ